MNWRDSQSLKPLKKGKPRTVPSNDAVPSDNAVPSNDAVPSDNVVPQNAGSLQQTLDDPAVFNPPISTQSIHNDLMRPVSGELNTPTDLSHVDVVGNSLKRGLGIEETYQATGTKRQKVDRNSRSDKEKGTAAQRATIKMQRNKAKKQPSFLPPISTNEAESQDPPVQFAGEMDQSLSDMYPFSQNGNYLGSQPINDVDFNSFAADGNGSNWDSHPVPGRLEEPCYQPDPASGDPTDQFLTRPSSGVAVPALTSDISSGFPNVYPSPSGLGGSYGASYTVPGYVDGPGPHPNGYQEAMQDFATESQQVPLQEPFNPEDYPNDLSHLGSFNGAPFASPYEQVVPETLPVDYRDYEPRDNIHRAQIREALRITLQSFEEAHPFDDVPATGALSYNAAITSLEARHRSLCEAQGQHVTPLPRRGPWYYSLHNWDSAREF